MNEQPPVPAAKTSGLAITSLVLGISSFCLGPLTAIPAFILGIVALSKIKKSAGAQTGLGLVIAGFCTAGVGMIVGTALLAALVVPKMVGSSEHARHTTAMTDIEAFRTTLSLYELDTGAYPTTEQGLQVLVARPANNPNWKGPYVDSGKIKNDPWSHPYMYRYPGMRNPTGFDLYSLGRDGMENTDDDIGNW